MPGSGALYWRSPAEPAHDAGMRSPLGRTSLAAEILLVLVVFLSGLMLVSGRTIVAAAEPGKSGTPMGGGAADKAAELLAVHSEGALRSEVEKRTDITPRLTFIYPARRDGAVTGALVSRFSLE